MIPKEASVSTNRCKPPSTLRVVCALMRLIEYRLHTHKCLEWAFSYQRLIHAGMIQKEAIIQQKDVSHLLFENSAL